MKRFSSLYARIFLLYCFYPFYQVVFFPHLISDSRVDRLSYYFYLAENEQQFRIVIAFNFLPTFDQIQVVLCFFLYTGSNINLIKYS